MGGGGVEGSRWRSRGAECRGGRGRFDVVAQLARELEARRLGRAGNVVNLDAARRGGTAPADYRSSQSPIRKGAYRSGCTAKCLSKRDVSAPSSVDQPSIGFVQRHRTFVGHVAAKCVDSIDEQAGDVVESEEEGVALASCSQLVGPEGTRRHGPRRRSSRSRAPREGLPAPSRPVAESRRRDEARRGSRLSPCRSSRSASSGLSRRRRAHVGSVRGEHAGGQGVERRGALPSDCADASSGLLKSQAPPDSFPSADLARSGLKPRACKVSRRRLASRGGSGS